MKRHLQTNQSDGCKKRFFAWNNLKVEICFFFLNLLFYYVFFLWTTGIGHNFITFLFVWIHNFHKNKSDNMIKQALSPWAEVLLNPFITLDSVFGSELFNFTRLKIYWSSANFTLVKYLATLHTCEYRSVMKRKHVGGCKRKFPAFSWKFTTVMQSELK